MQYITIQSPIPSCRHRAFTLIELLVVISIISLLISILLPALASARKQAQITQCLSQIRQIAIASFAYEADNQTLPFVAKDQGGNPWPSSTTWATVLTDKSGYMTANVPSGTDAHMASWALMCPLVRVNSQGTSYILMPTLQPPATNTIQRSGGGLDATKHMFINPNDPMSYTIPAKSFSFAIQTAKPQSGKQTISASTTSVEADGLI